MYYRNAQAAVVVYDVTKAASLEKAKSWVKEPLQRQANPNIVIALAGNKVDLVQPTAGSSSSAPSSSDDDEADDATATPGESDSSPTPGSPENLRQVPTEEAQAYATEANLLFFETSAKTGDGIIELFTEIGMSPSPSFATCSPRLAAKKIPVDHILSPSKAPAAGGQGRPQGVNLNDTGNKTKEACNC